LIRTTMSLVFRLGTGLGTRLILLIAMATATQGCRTPEASVEPSPSETAQPQPEQPEPAEISCSNERFADYDWVPNDARLTTSIQRGDSELPAALGVLARMSETPDLQLPVFATLDFRNLGLQLGALDRMLVELELAPAELVELQGPHGELAWVWATDCPPTTIAARTLGRFGVMLRADLERPGLRHGAGTIDRFPFDLLALGEHRVALTPLGRGAHVGAWLHGSSSSPTESQDHPGRALAEIPAAPIRTVLAGEALLTSTTGPTPARLRRIQVSATTWNES
jgi:hypothetical protein